MPTLIPDCIREEKEGRVTLVHPNTGKKVSMGEWEARVLPYLPFALDGRGISAQAAEAGVNMPADHVNALLERLRAAGLLLAVGAAETRPPRPAPAPAAERPLWKGEGQTELHEAPEPLRAHEEADELHVAMLTSPSRKSIPVIPAATSKPAAAAAKDLGTVPPTMLAARPGPDGAVDAFREELTDGIRVFKTMAISTGNIELSVSRPTSGAPPLPAPAQEPLPPPPTEPSFEPLPPASKTLLEEPVLPLRAEGTAGTEVLDRWPQRVRAPIRWGRVLTTLGAVVALGLVAALVPVPYTERAPCVLLPLERRALRAEVDGSLVPEPLDEGSPVKEGQLLATIDAPSLKADLAAITAEIFTIQTEIEKLRVGERPDVVRARTLVQARVVAQRQAADEFRKVEALHAKEKAGAEELQKVTVLLATARKSLTDAQAALVDKLSMSAQDELRIREADLERLKARQMRMVDQASRLEVRSPLPGRLATPYFKEKAGLAVRAGDEVAQVIQLEQLRAEARLTEGAAAQIRVGERVVVRLAGGRELSTTIDAVGASVEGKGTDRFVRVFAPIQNSDLALRQNATATMLVRGGSLTLLELFRRRLDDWLR